MKTPVNQATGNHRIPAYEDLGRSVTLGFKHQETSSAWLLIGVNQKTAGHSQTGGLLLLHPAPVVSTMTLPLL